jgi:hypothetical protein
MPADTVPFAPPDHLKRANESAKERPVGLARPLPVEVFDYSGSAQLITSAMMHLDEGLPLGQRQRCEHAYKALMQGAAELGVWMRAHGFNV